MKKENILEKIKQQKIMPLYYHHDAEVCVETAKALYAAGIRIIEFTNRGEHALKNFEALVKYRDKHAEDLLLATGTIKTSKEVRAFNKAGADFLISPVFDEWIGVAAQEKNILWIPGCMTPSEIHAAEYIGCRIVKLFPGNVLGPSFVSAVKELFPKIEFMPTGGVEATKENLQAWFNAGVCAVGLGSKLITKQLLEAKDYATIEKTTKEILELISTIKT